MREHRVFLKWWTRQGSNLRPPACHAGALPAELRARKTGTYSITIFAGFEKFFFCFV